MKCIECTNEKKLVHCFDTGGTAWKDDKSYAGNMYFCDDCLIYCKESVWDYPGKIWLWTNDTCKLEKKN